MKEFQVFLNESMPRIRIEIGTIQWHLVRTVGARLPIEYFRLHGPKMFASPNCLPVLPEHEL